MNEQTVIYVTIGVPFSKIPMIQKASVWVDLEVGQTQIQAAKKLRKMVADHLQDYGWVKGIHFTPAELYYEIYRDALGDTNERPVICSANAPAVKALKEKANRGEISLVQIKENILSNTIDLSG